MLQDSSLLRQHAFLNGQWTPADSGHTFAVHNPATSDELAQVADCGPAETARAVAAADAALPAWRAMTAYARAALLRKWQDLILANLDDLARLMTLEQGKPLTESKGEVAYGASFIDWFAEEGKRAYGDIIPPHAPGLRLLVHKQPVGVVGAITPWNFPIAMITRKVAPALAAGCTVVVKPSEETPLCALALAELAQRAGIPAGVFNVVPGLDAPAIGKVLTDSPVVRKISFTGSTEVGKILMRQCADNVKKLSLELGGNAPFIVFDDADVDAAVAGAVTSKYRNAGQTCVCANRIFVQTAVYEDFMKKFTAAVAQQKVGSGLEQGVQVGPLINAEALDKVQRLVADAVGKGAVVATGGAALGGTFFQPTVLAGVKAGMDILDAEIFGPVAPVVRFQDEKEAVALANDTPYGLASYFYGRDISRIFRVAEALDYGMVGVNTGLLGTAAAPFGGMKESGLGREGSKYGLEDFLEIKYICIGI
jgi:succinate-semialdehyde dehydrogenase / glutarate-semialdehyde dehydrogenase